MPEVSATRRGRVAVVSTCGMAAALWSAYTRRITATKEIPLLRPRQGVIFCAHPGLLWTHNDSGDDAYIYATDLAGTDRGTVRVRGATAVDWEDIALGTCPTSRRTCLYIADTGDNDERRKSVVIYAVPEPEAPGAGENKTESGPAAALHVKYSGGPDDVEALYVGPDRALYLVSKGRNKRSEERRVGKECRKSTRLN